MLLTPQKKIITKNKIMELKNRYDVIVAGAGIAGISAAIKAGRLGSSVLLIERYGFVGGMSTAGMVSPFMKHSVNGETLVRGVFEDLEMEMRSLKGMIDNGFYGNTFRAAAFHLLEKAEVTVLLNAEISKVSKSQSLIKSVKILVEGLEKEIEANTFVDTTGDAQLVYLGDFPWVKGDEATGLLQALTLFFRMGGIDLEKATEHTKKNKENFFGWMDYNFDMNKIISVAGYFNEVKKAVSENRLPKEIQYIFYTSLPSSGEASFNTSNILGLDGSTSSDLTQAELVGRKQVYQVVKLLRDEIPGFENAYLTETAIQVGVRETRRAVGDYTVTGQDIKSGAKFDDAVARGCYGIDIHGQQGEESRMENLNDGEYYEVPLRSLIVKEADNLLVAGRCLSATREGHSALRIMPTSSAMGEAAGTLASIAAKNNQNVRDIRADQVRQEIKHNISLR